MSATRPDDIVEGVKNAVSSEILHLDPTLTVRQTSYFNHTYIPDLVVGWNEQGQRHERRIFLRGSLGAVLDSSDILGLSDQEPVLLGLTEESEEVLTALRERLPRTTRSLATEVASVARITEERDPSRSDSQLSNLVRTNLIRGGRGLLSSREAERIGTVESGDPRVALDAFQETVEDLFVGATAERLNRTASLLSTFFDAELSAEVLEQIREDPLSDGELGIVLPYLLARASSVVADGLWEAFGSTLTLERIENLAGVLEGYDLTPLVTPNAHRLLGKRALLAANPDELAADDFSARPAQWRMRSQLLSADIASWALFVSSDGRRLRGRDGGAEARWDEISGELRQFALHAVKLHGLSRKLEVAGENPGEVRSDVESIRDLIDDDFHVPEVIVSDAHDEDVPQAVVEFAAGTVTGTNVPVDFLVKAASLLARRQPFSAETLARLTLFDARQMGFGSADSV